MEILNCRIETANLGFEDHGIFTLFLSFDGGGWGQGIPGICWGTQNSPPTGTGISFLMDLFTALEIMTFSELKGMIVRIRREEHRGMITGIGHPIKNKWVMLDDYWKK